MRHELEIRLRLETEGVFPSEHLGQHILTDESVINIVVNQVNRGSNVLEVGSGSGNLTERIASRASKVVGIEIDRKFQPFLDEVQSSHSNVEIIYKDVLRVNIGKIVRGGFARREWQIVSNLPFHISEPFLTGIIGLPIENAVLVVGNQLAYRMQIDSPEDPKFSKTSLATQTFFEPVVLTRISRGSFFPQPRTDAALVVLYPREKTEFESSPRMAILRNLFLSERRNPTVAKVLKNSLGAARSRPLLSKREEHRLERRRLKQELRQLTRGWQSGLERNYERGNGVLGGEIEKLDLPKDILSKPFSRLDNYDLRILAAALKRRYG